MDKKVELNLVFEGQVAEITLGPPPGNILDEALMDELLASFKQLESPEFTSLKMILIQGSGKHFSFGASVEEHLPERVATMLPKFHSLIATVLKSPVPTMAKVKGACLGGGFELALACSLFFCEESCSCGVPEIQLGVFPPPAAVLLPFKATQARCNEMILSGNKFKGVDLQDWGIANATCPKGELEPLVRNFLEEQILPRSASSLRMAHQAAQMSIQSHFETFIGRTEILYLQKLMQTADAKEGLESFLEKREPQWKNQ
jgi:cyclohexa-1,5-dienecarbonyl-CoA hydratase